MTNPWDIINEPIHHIRAPSRSMSLRAFLILGIIGAAIGALIAFAQIYEVM